MRLWNSIRQLPELHRLFVEDISTRLAKRDRSLICTLVIILIALLATAVVLLPLLLLKPGGIAEHRAIGESHGYVKAALLIQESLNTKVNPCDDFYDYVCGNYVKNNPIPRGGYISSEFARISEKTDLQLMNLLQNLAPSSSRAINKLKVIFNVCLDKDGYWERTPKVVMEKIKSVGHWPMVMGESGNVDMQKSFEKFASIGVKSLWAIYETRDFKDKSKLVLLFEQGEPLIDWKFYKNVTKHDKEIAAHKKRIRSRVEQFTLDNGYPENSNLDRDLEDLFKFDADVAKIMRDPKIQIPIEKAYNPEHFDTFNDRMKVNMGLDLKAAELVMVPEFARGMFTPETVVLVEDPKFAENIAKIVKQVKPETFVNYIQYSLMSKYNEFYGGEYIRIDEILHEDLNGDKGEGVSMWDVCKKLTKGKMKKAFGALYARSHFDHKSKDVMMEMIGNLKEAFMEMVDESDWMDEETKKAAKFKAQEMIPHIGYGELAFDDEKLDAYYKGVSVANYEDFFALLESLEEWEKTTYFRKLLLPDDRTEFFDVASTVNAFFAPQKNAILFPAAFLQFPYFVRDQPQSLNYGSIGSVIGHEITHGFDNKGKDYDELGQLKNWWEKETLKKYKERTQCMVDQYDAVEAKELGGAPLNGTRTLGENIADNGGIRESFKAYKKYVKRHGQEPKVPGVTLTDDQLFFVGYANGYCSAANFMYLWFRMMDDEHSLDRYRTNVVMQNSKDFSKAFQCPVGSPMNPEKKCRVW